MCVFLLFLLDGLWPVGAVVVVEAVDVLYGTQLLTVRTPAFFIIVIHPLILVLGTGSKVVVHILCCYFLSVHNNLQPNPIQTSNSLQVPKKTITNQIIAFFITFVTKTQPTTLIRIRSRTVLHHYLIRIQYYRFGFLTR